MAVKYQFRVRGKLYAIEPAGLTAGGKIRWIATGGGETIAEGQSTQAVLDRLIDSGFADQNGLRKKLYEWDAVRLT